MQVLTILEDVEFLFFVLTGEIESLFILHIDVNQEVLFSLKTFPDQMSIYSFISLQINFNLK